MAIKIIIRRRVTKEKEAKLLPLLVELRSKATTQPGYISGETLRNVNDPQDFIVISTWQSVEAWKTWEASKGRAEIQNRIDTLLGEKAKLRDLSIRVKVHGTWYKAHGKAKSKERGADSIEQRAKNQQMMNS